MITENVIKETSMTANTNPQMDSLTEKIKHQTEGRPFSIHHTDVAPAVKTPLYIHCHTELEFFHLTEGELDFYIERNVYHMRPEMPF